MDTSRRGPVQEVAIVSWPPDQRLLDRLRRRGQPRLLLVPHEGEAPVDCDVLEDWVRLPTDPVELQARVDALKARATSRSNPLLDADTRLHVGSRWVALSPIERQLAAPLVERFGGLVSQDTLLRAGWPEGCPSRNQLDVQLLRLRRRVESVGLRLHTVRARGYSLAHADE
jgi:DNA-binding response OmpR family regulator